MFFYIFINCFSFLLVALDKYFAINNKWRVSERLLFGIAFIGGAGGTYLGAKYFHHKNKKYPIFINYVLPLLICLEVVLFLKISSF